LVRKLLQASTGAVNVAVFGFYFAITDVAAWDAFSHNSVEICVLATVAVASLQRINRFGIFIFTHINKKPQLSLTNPRDASALPLDPDPGQILPYTRNLWIRQCF